MPQLYLLSSDMSLINPSPTGLKAAGRTLGTYQGQPIIVEWKHYSTKIPPALLSNLKRRVDMLTLQLQRSSQTAGFSVLPCVGHFDDEPRHRIGIVFERPDNTTPISLRERMAQDRRSNRVRELGQRFNVAKTIVLAIYRMHSVGWLHKSMLSENILFSESVNEDALHLSTPFLCGFDFSRPDAPNEMTERIPSIMIQVYNDQERSLYRHPDLDYKHSAEDPTKLKPRSTRYRKEYDIYSLGIILLEIGLWYPIKDLSKKDQTLEEFRQRLLEKYLPELRYRMGDRYFNVVHKCLCGGFGNESSEIAVSEGSSTEEEYICEYEQSQKFIEAFARDAVEELEKCEV
jgi:serine/threonine protein kinase